VNDIRGLLGGHRSHVGPASFGGLSGSLYSLGDGTEIQVNPGTAHTYQIDGSDVGPTTLVNIAAALRIVPRSWHRRLPAGRPRPGHVSLSPETTRHSSVSPGRARGIARGKSVVLETRRRHSGPVSIES
jgi:hypothetical protein